MLISLLGKFGEVIFYMAEGKLAGNIKGKFELGARIFFGVFRVLVWGVFRFFFAVVSFSWNNSNSIRHNKKFC